MTLIYYPKSGFLLLVAAIYRLTVIYTGLIWAKLVDQNEVQLLDERIRLESAVWAIRETNKV